MARIAVSAEELGLRQEEIADANRRHDGKYGMNYQRMGWRSGFEPAAPKLDRESIWNWHRSREDQGPLMMP
jgi:hypothetical protein